MKKFYLLAIFCAAFLAFAPLASHTAFAQSNNSSSGSSSNNSSSGTSSNSSSGSSSSNSSSSTSSSKDFGLSQTTGVSLPDESPAVFVGTIIRWIMGMLGVLLVGLFVYGGVTYATAAGNEQRAADAKRILTYAVIGTVIVVASAIISEFVINALISPPSNNPVISNNSSQGSSVSGSAGGGTASAGSATANTAAGGSVGNPGSGVSAANPTGGNSNNTGNASASNNNRLPPTNTRGLASICVIGSTACETGLQCIKQPTGAQSYCLIPRNKPCNTNTTSAVGTNGCEFNTRCVKKSNPVDASGLPDFSQPDGVCE